MSHCPCGSEHNYDGCCEPLHTGSQPAKTAEQLMRARYSAFATQNVDYIVSSHEPESRDEINPEEIKVWSEQSEWLGLEIVETEKGQPEDQTGTVEFKALYQTNGQKITHHEKADFKKPDDQWFFIDGQVFKEAIRRAGPKVSRNDPCPCGSGKKYKKCCS